MDPLSALLLAMLIAGYFTKNVYQDAVFRARGEDPPSFRREQARRERRAQRDGAAPDGPGRRFWRNAWADAVTSAEERRERITAKAAKKRRAKWAEQDAAAAEDEAYAINDRVTPDQATASSPMSRCHFCRNEFPAQDLWPIRDVTDSRVDACHPCWHKRNQSPEPDKPEVPKPAIPAQSGDAEIIQFADWQRSAASDTEKENTMSAEISGLRSAITFAEGSAKAAEAAAAQDEVAIAGLQAGGTTGSAITALHAAAEGHRVVAGYYNTAAVELRQHLQVAEAYETNQGAGSREFVKSE